jgi:hypothetical protein
MEEVALAFEFSQSAPRSFRFAPLRLRRLILRMSLPRSRSRFRETCFGFRNQNLRQAGLTIGLVFFPELHYMRRSFAP